MARGKWRNRFRNTWNRVRSYRPRIRRRSFSLGRIFNMRILGIPLILLAVIAFMVPSIRTKITSLFKK